MLTTFAAAALMIQGSPATSGGALVSKMLAKYYGAKTMKGEINYTATDGQGKAGVKTVFQFKQPSQLYIRQEKWGGSNPQTWIVSSDGKFFSYNTPSNIDWSSSDKRLVEPVTQNGEAYSYQKIYGVAAAFSLGDRSMPLDVAIGASVDLKHLSLTWINASDKGVAKVNGVDAHVVTGDWRPYGNNVNSGRYEMDIAEDGSLVRYIILRPFILSDGSTIPVTETWDVSIQVNGEVDPNLFRVVK